MANIQIADLHSENFVELTAEEQSLIQCGIWPVVFIVLPFVINYWPDIKKGVYHAWNGK